MGKYDEIPFKNDVKQLVDIAMMITKLNKGKFKNKYPTLQWYTRVLEKSMINKVIKSSKINLKIPITFERDNVGFVAYLMDVKGMSFDDAYSRVFIKEDIIYYVTFLGHRNLQINLCGLCDGEGTVPCNVCDAYGWVKCDECDDGSIPCDVCDGRNDENCDGCNGTHLKDCEACDGGDAQTTCPECSGYTYVDCEECDNDSFENYEVEFEADFYIIIDDRIKEISSLLNDGQKNISQFEHLCDTYDPPIEYSFFRTSHYEISSEYESTDWRHEVELQGLKFEDSDFKISIYGSHEYPDSTLIDDILEEMF